MENYKLKLSIFILLITILLITIFYSIFGFSVSYLSEEEIKQGRKPNENLINYLKINNINTVYSKSENTYYYSVPENYKNNKYTLKLELDDGYKYKIVDHVTNIITIDYKKDYNIIIYNAEDYYEAKIRLTKLPLISITTEDNITDNNTNIVFKYINPSNLDKELNYNAKIKIRGATTRKYDKKSYKIEMFDKDYEKDKNINISNFYFGSVFILDAMYRDNSKIRNNLAIDFWNYFSDDYKNIDIYTEYVELFINNEYFGLYTFTEPINRKKLNLNKSGLNNTSVIIKSNNWTVPNHESNYNGITKNYYLDYELKYPNEEELFPIAWENIISKLFEYYNAERITYEVVDNSFNTNNYIDLVLFNSFIENADNHLTKNNYFYLNNLGEKVYIQPWDMEFSFGLLYDYNKDYDFNKNMENFDKISISKEILNDKKLKKLIINRYWNLRNNILNEKYINKILDKYINLLNDGAASRDAKKWLEYDVKVEIEDIRTWLINRLKYYDKYIRGLENE